jgi:hypothetical protein
MLVVRLYNLIPAVSGRAGREYDMGRISCGHALVYIVRLYNFMCHEDETRANRRLVCRLWCAGRSPGSNIDRPADDAICNPQPRLDRQHRLDRRAAIVRSEPPALRFPVAATTAVRRSVVWPTIQAPRRHASCHRNAAAQMASVLIAQRASTVTGTVRASASARTTWLRCSAAPIRRFARSS